MASPNQPVRLQNIIGSSPVWQTVLSVVERAAPSRATILLLGETGTGKELLAKAIHACSDRKNRSFVRVNCGALSGALLESELFGHVKGSFTGAIEDKIGRFEAANFGTLFLDEIGTLDLALQVKLLRVLQEREFERVGSARTVSVDVRIIAASNLDLFREVQINRFREDLYYRLNVVTIHLPPLRKRLEDLPLLIAHFLEKYNIENSRSLNLPTMEAAAILNAYPWPGNVRELENVCERAVVLSESDEFNPELLPAYMRSTVGLPAPAMTDSARRSSGGGESWPKLLEQAAALGMADPAIAGTSLFNHLVGKLEENLIRSALARCGGVKTRAADYLGVNRNTLHKKCQEYGIDLGAEGPEEAGA
jgi:Nif-specific regulatory protein